jgi:hypothetical protein
MQDSQKTQTNTRRTVWRVAGVMLFILATGLVYHLLWGRLFAWSPMKLGYHHQAFSRATIVLPGDWDLPAELRNVDEILADCERFHALQFSKHITIILARTPEAAYRYSGTRGAACAFQTGTVIFLSPTKIQANGRNLVDQLKHECSHAVLDQNTSLYRAFNVPEWFREGLAIYYGNPHDNYTGATFLELAVDRGYFFDVLGSYEELKRVPEHYRYGFKHSEFRCFVEYLAATLITVSTSFSVGTSSITPLFQRWLQDLRKSGG